MDSKIVVIVSRVREVESYSAWGRMSVLGKGFAWVTGG